MQKIDSGTFGTVFNKNKDTVIKEIQKFSSDDLSYENTSINECVFLSQYKHPNIINAEHITIGPKTIQITMENGKTNLNEFVFGHEFETRMEHIPYILFQIVSALHFMHSNNVVHGDLKPANILYDKETKVVKLIDFGGVVFLHKSYEERQALCTYEFSAPENWYDEEELSNSFMNSKTDVWSLGMIVLFCFIESYDMFGEKLKGYEAYQTYFKQFHKQQRRKYFKLTKEQIEQIRTTPSFGNQFVNMFKKMLALDPKNRISSSELYYHKFFEPYRQKEKHNMIINNYIREPTLVIEQYQNNIIGGQNYSNLSEFIYHFCESHSCLDCYVLSLFIFNHYRSKFMNIEIKKIELALLCALMIASLLMKHDPLEFSLLEHRFKKKYQRNDFINMTDHILHVLNFNVYKVTFDRIILFTCNTLNYAIVKNIMNNIKSITLNNSQLIEWYHNDLKRLEHMEF